MRVVPISEIYQMDANDTVDSVVGVITDVWDYHAGTNSKGEYSFQKFKLRDASGEIKCELKDRSELSASEWKGRKIHIVCNQGERGKTGMKAKDDEYKGKVTRILSITPSAQMELADDAASKPAPQNGGASPKAEPAKAQPPEPAAQNGNGHATDVRKQLNKLANLYLHCLEAGSYVANTYATAHNEEMTEAQYQACVSSLFIQSTRDLLHMQVQPGQFKK